MYKLVIAEKPSVAQSIAKVIGATNRKDAMSRETTLRNYLSQVKENYEYILIVESDFIK